MEENKIDLTQNLLDKQEKYQNISFEEEKHSSHSEQSSSSFDAEIYKIPDIDVQKGAVRRLITVSVVCLLLMVGKLVGGLIANSLAILTDAAHMFSDLSGFQISLISLFIARRPANTSMSYGYHRAEVIGAMASVILIWGLTVWLVTEATQRIIKMDYEINGLVMLITAVLGLITNLLMFKILHSEGHGHSHNCPGHSHKHGGNEKKQLKIQDMDFAEDEGLNDVEKEKGELEVMIKNMKKNKKEGHGHAHAHGHVECKEKEDKKGKKLKVKEKSIEMQNEPQMSEDNEQFVDKSGHKHPECETKKTKKKEGDDDEDSHSQRSENLSIIDESENPNLRAAWIHMLGDTISSFGAVVASIIIYFWQWMKIVDPICTYFFAILVLLTTIPISRDCISVLMEGTPVGLSVDDFEQQLKQIKGVISVHDIHIWQLSAGKPSMSCHIIAKDPNFVLKKATRLCRKKGIYHSTIQIEDLKMINEVDAIKCEQNIH